MKRLITTLAIASMSALTYAGPISDEQIKTLCKIVDPTFINQLPVFVELKNAKVKRKYITGPYAYINSTYGSTNGTHIVALETWYESDATTVEGAIKVMEDSCMAKIKEVTNR